jgi:hypothetical protein
MIPLILVDFGLVYHRLRTFKVKECIERYFKTLKERRVYKNLNARGFQGGDNGSDSFIYYLRMYQSLSIHH